MIDQDDAVSMLLSSRLDELVGLAEQLSQPAYAYAVWWEVLLALACVPSLAWMPLDRLLLETTIYVVRELRAIG